MTKKRASRFGLGQFPIQTARNFLANAASNTPVYDPLDLDLQYENNEAARLMKLKMWVHPLSIDAPPTDGETEVRFALLDDPNAVINLDTDSEFSTRPEILAYGQEVWGAEQGAATQIDALLKLQSEFELDFPNGGVLVGRNLQYTLVVVESASMFPLTWQLRTELWYKKERVSDAMFKQIMYGVRF